MADTYTALGTDRALCNAFLTDTRIAALEFLDSIDSTQRRARELAAEDAPDWTIVVADYQSAGRGQHGRRWSAVAGSSVMFSLIIRPKNPEAMALLPIRIGIATATALESVLPADARVCIGLKWPNDLMTSGGKVGGILCEGQVRGTDLRAIAGVGINVRTFDVEPEIGAAPYSLDALAGRELDRLEVLRAVAGRIRRSVDTATPELGIDELAQYAERDWLAGRTIVEPVAGSVVGINESGHLVVRTPGGTIESVVAGSVRAGDA
jgi:BirA family biotin operon repressor/biotin-[acetyl-CoA-carboxylase] ligase